MKLTVRLTMAMVAVAAFALSFQSLAELGALAGYGRLAFLYPLVVDLGTVSSCTAWLATRSRQAFWMTWVLLSVSVIQNGTVHWLLATGQRPAWWLVTLVATVPPATLGLVVHLGVGLGTEVAKKYPQVSDGDLASSKLDEGNAGSNLDRVKTAGNLPEVSGKTCANLAQVSNPVAALVESGAGRRQIAAQLGVTEYQARKLITASRNGDGP